MNDLVGKCIARQGTMESDRSMLTSLWQTINTYIACEPDIFYNNYLPAGTRFGYYQEPHASMSLHRAVATVKWMITPSNQVYHRLTTTLPDDEQNDEVNRYLQKANDILFKFRQDPTANFNGAELDMYMMSLKYGTGALFIGESEFGTPYYKSIHLAHFFVAENQYGRVNTLYRKLTYTAAQAIEAFGFDNLCKEIQKDSYDAPENKYDFLHVVQPNNNFVKDSKVKTELKFIELYIDIGDKSIIESNGYHVFPYVVPRVNKYQNEVYGRGLSDLCLQSVVALMHKNTAYTNAINDAIDPLLLTKDGEDVMGVMNAQNGKYIYGGVDENGKPTVIPMERVQPQVLNSMQAFMQQDIEVINEAFLSDIFDTLKENPQMTATQVMQLVQEKGALLSPMMSTFQVEYLEALVERELDILQRNGYIEDNGKKIGYKIEYLSPLAIAQQAGKAKGILDTLQQSAEIAQFDNTIINLFDFETIIRQLTQMNGAPLEILKTPEEYQALKQQQMQQQQAQNLLQAAPQIGDTAKSFAQAQALQGRPNV